MIRYFYMEQNRSKYRIAKMAQWLQVSKSGYYAWRKRSKSLRCMENESLLTTVTSGEKTDGKELPELVRKSREAGMEVEMVIGDTAYSEQKNIEAAQDGGYELISRLNSIITQGNRTKKDEFEFNKDAGMYQCKA